jgi:hypothetical protein
MVFFKSLYLLLNEILFNHLDSTGKFALDHSSHPPLRAKTFE